MNPIIETTTLDNGLRIVAANVPDSGIEYCGLSINVGSREDPPGKEGLAHFVEHTIFKGTQKHKPHYILKRMDIIGGELNAFTNKEETVVYTIAPLGYFHRAANLLFEIVATSVFPADELDKEREVIAEEIDSYLDTPAEAIFDDIDEMLFKDSSLAHNILGNKESLSRLSSNDCKDWLQNKFIPCRSVFFYLGPLKPEKVIRIIERIFTGLADSSTKHCNPSIRKVGHVSVDKRTVDLGLHQTHVVSAFRIPGIDNRFQYEYLMLSNILGGPGMNSRLNMSLREKRGLVYTVESNVALYSDAGGLYIYYACDKKDENKCRGLIYKELEGLIDKYLTDKALSIAKRQYLGQLAVASDNKEHLIMSAARSMLTRNRLLLKKELEEKVNAVSPHSLKEAAINLSPDKAFELVFR